jgi:hypothetical protein
LIDLQDFDGFWDNSQKIKEIFNRTGLSIELPSDFLSNKINKTKSLQQYYLWQY